MGALDNYKKQIATPPGSRYGDPSYYDVTPSDSVPVRSDTVLVGVNASGGAGDIAIEQTDGTTFTFNDMQPGGSFCSDVVKVLATGTTATGLYIGVMS